MEKTFKRNTVFILILTVLFLSSFTLFANLSIAQGQNSSASKDSVSSSTSLNSYTPKSPIVITANSGFTSAGFTGAGTPTSPYILNGYNITTVSSLQYAVSITGTNASVVIQNCYISSTSYTGLSLNTVSNVVIKNNVFHLSDTGIGLVSSSNILVENNVITNSTTYGISVSNGQNNAIVNNLITNSSDQGVYSYISNYLTLTNNTISFSQNDGIYSYGNGNSTISYNNISYNDLSGNVNAYGIYDTYYSSNMTYSHNIVDHNGNDGFWTYLYGPQTISDNTVQFNTGNGIYFGFGGPAGMINLQDNLITNNTEDGVNIDQALNNSVTNNTILYNGGNGVNFGMNNYNNTVSYNTIIGNSLDGILVNSSSGGVTVNENIIKNNYNGINLNYDSGIGSNATITNNTFQENRLYGLKDAQNNNNTISYNTFINNSVVNLYMYNVSNDKIYLNNFLEKNDTCGCQVQEYNTTNSYTNGHFGNYWMDYTGIDGNNDGIGDTNYTLAGLGVANDTLPLMHPSTLNAQIPSMITYNEGITTKTFSWNVYAYDSISANLFVNGTLFKTFSSNNAIWNKILSFDLGGKSAGTYILLMSISDLNTSLQYQFSSTLTVLDVTAPVLTVSSNSISYVVGSTGNVISFNASDLHPDSYIVYQNGTQKLSGTWTSSANISISIDGLNTGFYNFTVIVFDQSHNSASVTFTIHILPKPVTSPGTNTSSTSTGTTSTISTPGFGVIVTIVTLLSFIGFYWKRKNK